MGKTYTCLIFLTIPNNIAHGHDFACKNNSFYAIDSLTGLEKGRIMQRTNFTDAYIK